MASIRGRGEGTIYRMPSGKWRAQFSNPHGKRISHVGETQSECQMWLAEKKLQLLGGATVLAGDVELEVFIQNWLQSISASRSPNTILLYARVLKPICGILGRGPVNTIRPDHVQSAYNQLLENGVSTYSVKQIHKVLHAAFAFAKKLRIIIRNPVSDATPPKHISKKMSFYDADQVQALLFGAQIRKDVYYPLYYLAISTGMRQGELLGLKWTDVDWTKSELRVERQLVMYPNGHIEFRPPKSKSGFRAITVGSQVLDLLSSHFAGQQELQANHSENWNVHKLVFPSTTGTPVNASNLRRSFRKLLEFTGLPKIRFHDLRHTAATLMLNYGTPVPVVSQRLGHAKTSMTMDTYAHALPSKQAETAELMDDLLSRKPTITAHDLHTKDQYPLS